MNETPRVTVLTLLALTGLVLGAPAPPARATTFVAMSEHALAREADGIVAGVVRRLESVEGRDGAISTLVAVEVERTYKGPSHDLVVLKQPGGRVGDRTMWIAGSPRFTVGERNLLFLSAHRDGTVRTTAYGMGQFQLVPGSGTGGTLAMRTLSEAVLGGSRARRLSLARLERTIARAVARDAGRAVAPFVAVPAEATDPALARETLDAFTLMDQPHGRWHEPDLGQPVVYEVAGSDAKLGPAESVAALDGATAAWTNVSGATIVLQRGGSTPAAPLLCDGISQIVFNDPFNEMPPPVSCSGILALGGYCTSGQTDVVNGVTFYRISEGNVTMSNGFGGCGFWNTTNVAEILAHEIGHTIGIGHSSESDTERDPVLTDATMYYRAHFDGRGASVHADDIAAVRFLYPGSPSGNPATDDTDGDGVPDAQDNCPDLANESQTDTDGDGYGDLCDPCPLVAGKDACDVILVNRLKASGHSARSRLLWRAAIDLPAGSHPATARILLVSRNGVVLDRSMGAPLAGAAWTRGRARYRDDQVVIRLTPDPTGLYRVRVSGRGLALDLAGTPLISGSLQVGDTAFSGSLSCSRQGRARLVCRG